MGPSSSHGADAIVSQRARKVMSSSRRVEPWQEPLGNGALRRTGAVSLLEVSSLRKAARINAFDYIALAGGDWEF